MQATVITKISRDEAKELARERLSEVLGEVIPGFRPERAFRCLNPDHEDRHPSARYLSRTNTVKCFACGWSGDVFDVVGAVYGLTGGDAFAKAYDMLGLDPKAGGHSRRSKPTKSTPKPGTWDEIVTLIYPPGWDVTEEIPLPMPLEVLATAEAGIAGCLLKNPDRVAACVQAGLRGKHFDDAELGELYEAIMLGDRLDDYAGGFLDWAESRALPAHMLRRSVRFIIQAGRRRMLEATLARASSHFQNGTDACRLWTSVLRRCEAITGERYKLPAERDDVAAVAFDRIEGGEDPAIVLADLFTRKEVAV